MLSYEEFKEQIVSEIKDHLPDKYQNADISFNSVTKSNDIRLDGLLISNPDEHNVPIPNIYVNDLYGKYQEGMSMNEIMDQIADIREMSAYQLGEGFDLSAITDYDQAKDQIVCRLCNLENNQQYLSDKPHTVVEDLAVTYHYQLHSDEQGTSSIPITNAMLASYGVDQETLHENALVATEQMTPAKFASMHETMMEIMLPDMMNSYHMSEEEARAMASAMMPPDPGNMFVLTNDTKLNGAAAILNDQMRSDIAEQVGGDFYVLPSSIHEVLIIPKSADIDVKDLENMVQEVNANEVAPQDLLSDHVYEYDAKDHELFRADRAAERQAEKEAAKRDGKSHDKMRDEKTRDDKPSILGKLNKAKDQVKDTVSMNAAPTRKAEVSL